MSQSKSESLEPMMLLRRQDLLLALLVSGLFGCSAMSTAASNLEPSGGAAGGTGGGTEGTTPVAGGTGGGSGGGSVAGAGGGTGQAGVLTAGTWDDNLNYEFFGKYVGTKDHLPGNPGFAQADYDASHTEFAQRAAHTTVDAALVLDTTGSMGDELAYLTAEFGNISNAIHAKFPSSDQRWALVLYRDVGMDDVYEVRSFDFTGDAQAFSANIAAQDANGGGDTPESPELGIGRLTQLSWRSDPGTAKIAFWVGDAPHHVQNAGAMKQAIQGAHEAGVHVYPVSASGTDDLLELTMRSAAQISGGRYLFLTDDSGIGDPHKVPEIPCYFVTRLKSALVRAVSAELTGGHDAPDAADLIRTEGSPSADGKCQMPDGEVVAIF